MQKGKKERKGKKSKSKAAAAVVSEEVQEPPAESGGGVELMDLDMGTKPTLVRPHGGRGHERSHDLYFAHSLSPISSSLPKTTILRWYVRLLK